MEELITREHQDLDRVDKFGSLAHILSRYNRSMGYLHSSLLCRDTEKTGSDSCKGAQAFVSCHWTAPARLQAWPLIPATGLNPIFFFFPTLSQAGNTFGLNHPIVTVPAKIEE